ncbi:MAG: hypothetical protein ABIT36_06385, partial [Steroidobacteraceae bacterium]
DGREAGAGKGCGKEQPVQCVQHVASLAGSLDWCGLLALFCYGVARTGLHQQSARQDDLSD